MNEVRAAYKEQMKVEPTDTARRSQKPSRPPTANVTVEDLDKTGVVPYYKAQKAPKPGDIRFPTDTEEIQEILEHMRYLSKYVDSDRLYRIHGVIVEVKQQYILC